MIDDRAHEHAPSAAAPPTTQGAIGRGPAHWPRVVGVVGIVLASLGILKALFTAGAPLLFASIWGPSYSGAGDDPASAELRTIDKLQWVSVVDGLAGLAVWVWGLVLFAGLLKKRRGSMSRAALWSWVKIGLGVASVTADLAVRWLAMQAMLDAMAKTSPPAGGPGVGMATVPAPFMMTVPVVRGTISLAATCVWPVFLLIWSRRAAVRAEVATW